MKSYQKQYRFDELTVQYLKELEKLTGLKQSEIVRSAIFLLARSELGGDKISEMYLTLKEQGKI